MTPDKIEGISARARCLFTEEAVEKALDKMANDITAALASSNPVLLCVMNGGLITAGKLATRLAFPLQIDYLHATRYRQQTSGADLQWKAYPSLPLQDRVVLIVDDILDEGATLEKIIDYCSSQGARRVYTAVLVEKMHDRKLVDIAADFVGLQAGDYYLYGYGMDFKGYLRNAAGIFAVDEAEL